MIQNIFDNEKFFNSYIELRESDSNYNVLLEQPAMMSLIPNIEDKDVLDLGCGFGKNCMDFIRAGAKSVVGVDVSERMLQTARLKNDDNSISYINLPLENLDTLSGRFDFIYSSLCFHYISDFEKLIKDIYNLLADKGVLLFSQEHPFITATNDMDERYIYDEKHIPYAFAVSNYQDESSCRAGKWFVDDVISYHRTFSTIMNTLTDVGFAIEKVVEPFPDDNAIEKNSGLKKEFIKPTFLIVKATKGC